MRAFRARDGIAVAELDSDERKVVARIVADVGLLLGDEVFGMDTSTSHGDDEEYIFRHLRGLEESLAAPDDPAILRLLPNASDDREVSDEFRRLTEPDLRTLKVDRLRRVWEQLSEEGPEWSVALEQVLPTAAALTDVRLVIASRLGLDTDEDAERLHAEIELAAHAMETDADEQLGVDPERVWLGMLYRALTWLQDSLVGIVTEDGDE